MIIIAYEIACNNVYIVPQKELRMPFCFSYLYEHFQSCWDLLMNNIEIFATRFTMYDQSSLHNLHQPECPLSHPMLTF